MADKSQTIFVNYKFNTAEIDKAQAAVNRANAASNALQQTASTAGQKISQGFRQATPSIAFMNTQLDKLKTQITTATDPKKIAELSAQFKVLKTNIDAATKSAFGLPKALNETKASSQSLTQQFGGLFTAVKLFVTAGVVREAASIAIEMAKLSGNVEGVERAFQRQVPNSVALLRDLRRATQGTSTDLDLMSKTLQAKNLGVPVQNLATFFEFAAIRAQQTGISVDYLTQSIVNGLGRKSSRVIDNLGISATRLKEEFHGVSLEQLSVAEVSQGLSNIIQEEMGKMGGYVETAATKVDQLSVSWQKLKEEASKALTGEGGAISLMKQYVDSFALLAEARNKDLAVAELAEQKRIQEIASISENEFARRVLKGTTEENVKAIEAEISELTKELGVWAKMRQDAELRIKDLEHENIAIGDLMSSRAISRDEARKEFLLNKESLALNERLRDAHKEDISIDQEILKLLQGRLAALKQVNEEEVKSTGIIERKKKEIEALQEAIEKTNNPSDLSNITGGVVEVGRLIKALEIAQAELADLQHTFSDIDIKPFEIKVKDATKAILEFNDAADNTHGLGALFDEDQISIVDRNVKSIEEGLQRLAAANPFTAPGQTVATQDTFWTELGKEFEKNWGEILSNGIDIQTGFINDALEAELDSMKRQLSALRDFYDQQQLLAGDNERAKKELLAREERATTELSRRIFEKEKKTRRSQAIIDGAAGVAKAFASYPYPAAIIISALIAAQVAAQLTAISRQRSGYAKGVIDLKGPGTSTSDSIPTNLSRGESVMTAWETRHAGNVLRDIRAKKLDNKMLKSLKQGRDPVVMNQKQDNSDIVRAIEKNKAPDVIAQSGLVFEVTNRTEIYHRKIRAKSVKL